MSPAYRFDDFKAACHNDTNSIFPFKEALEDAAQVFNLKSKRDLIEFIGNDGLEELQFLNTKPWENNPDKHRTVMVDAYEFRTMHMLGYIAIFYNDVTKKWIIKSFHLSENSNPAMTLAFKEAFKKIESKTDCKSGDENE